MTIAESRVQLELDKGWIANHPEIAADSIRRFRSKYRLMHIACIVEDHRVVYTATKEPNDNNEVFI